ncbi:Abortive infection protein [Emticicia oligotrophica DSM 17448]|uniref:Abortive infection protein n=1 Tax=Emticicia oligotrophica (strain DSM 17448 / CIP 109782 / MTCC 6937 / GPTSA100-15) TaxID=929562 RepID=A0ABM5N1R1_EMTOG|nr:MULTISPECIES: type II CAAX endopeptidase family protein [Emticicia]AFK03330.1 Abortive infection protein [Emticicia oligotrophica DSM 17448]
MLTKTFFSTPKGSNKWYNYILVPIYVVILAALFSVPAFIILSKPKPNTYQSYLQLLLPSAMLVFSTFLVLKWVHRRSGYSLINATKIRWNRIFWAMGCFGSITLLFELVSWFENPSSYQFSFDKSTFFQYLIISLVLIPFQSAGEELLMRGYFLQGIAWATKRPWLAVLITSVLFGLLHLGNPELKAFGYVFILNYMLMGLVAGIMTVMDDGTELAIGVHIINNLYSAIFIGYTSSALQTSTIYHIKDYDTTFLSFSMILGSVIFLGICYKKYQWNSFKSFFDKLAD